MMPLPIDSLLPALVEALRRHNAAVVVAAPGAGKTTRVPPALVGAGVLSREHPKLIMLQPRRVAARAAAERIAEEQGWRVGEEVGYQVRFEKRYGSATRIRILTEAILTRMLLGDPALEGIGCVILDEFHERSIHSDLALAFLREVQQTIRPDLKIVVMSATLDAGPVAEFLGGAAACPVIESPGRLFPIEVVYRPRDHSGDRLARPRLLEESHVAATIDEALQHEGDVLVFLPGAGEIERVSRKLATPGVDVLPLHGSLPAEDQQRALRPAAAGRRKVILATNIAETSLTIDGVRTVVDSGLVRVASYDADRGMDRLDLERISQASAAQRAGRAGRQAPGRAYRLWAEREQKHLAEFNVPEMHRVDLAAAVLAVHAWAGRAVRDFAWLDPPLAEALEAAESLLRQLDALDAEARLTPLGRAMMAVPAHPRIARMLLAAAGTPLAGDAVTLAAILSDDTRAAKDDPLAQLQRPRLELQRAREQFAGVLRGLSLGVEDQGNPNPHVAGQKAKIESAADLLLLAYPDRVARRRGNDPHAAVMVGGSGLRLAPEALTPALAEAGLFLALDPHHDPRHPRAEASVLTAVPLREETLRRVFPGAFHAEAALEYDTAREKVIAFSREYFRDLMLREDPHGRVDPAAAGLVLAAALAGRAAELFGRDEHAAKLLARVALLRQHMPEHAWPALDEVQLQELLGQAATGRRTLAELRDSSALADALRATLPYPLDRVLDQHAPEALEVPSGSRIKLEYAVPATPDGVPAAPVLAVRLQELFGLLETPRVAGGRVPVVLHLLSPGYKPMQITTDLRSFWSSAYFEVRKDLRVRYPKHKWPDDPLTAVPEAKGRRR